MHRITRAWNVPLGLALFGGAILVGGAILAYPDVTRAPSRVDVGDPIASRPFPSFPDEVPGIPPGMRATPAEAPISPTPPLPAGDDISAARERLPGDPERGTIASAPAAREGAAVDEAPLEADAPGAAPAAVGGGPPAENDGANAPPAASAAPETTATGGTATGGDAGGTESPGANAAGGDAGVPPITHPVVLPMFGAPPPAAPSGTVPPAVVSGAAGSTAPLYSGSSGGSANPAVTDPRPSVTAQLLVPMQEGTSPETTWTSISPFLRSGDLVVANVGSEALPFLGWSDRVRTDTPLVGYAIAFDKRSTLESAVTRGLPATLGAVGLSNVTGLNDKAIVDLSTRVRAAGKRFFVSTGVPTGGPSLPMLGARADVVELVIGGGDAATVAQTASQAVAGLHGGGRPQVFVRLPDVITGTQAATASNEITRVLPAVGVALPWSTGMDRLMSDLRANP